MARLISKPKQTREAGVLLGFGPVEDPVRALLHLKQPVCSVPFGASDRYNWSCLAEKSVRKANPTLWGHSCCANDTMLFGASLITEWVAPAFFYETRWCGRFRYELPG